ncbi:MAG: hypothetical protein R3189_02775 [Thiomicrorhabdus chilensis]|uniref:hypothetical protein n=1 Tax=Thiomicrorhabdus chilensis TaxID=63656 RepID=UPI00299EA846|nr:hypothetical protein [Thiomicrorhabdus chilensis]MDX1347157.1 hypothetical protein [Thiomicrorhabdus chilensis]
MNVKWRGRVSFFGKVFVFLTGIVVAQGVQAVSQQKVMGDYHLTIYEDAQGSVDGIELFTKLADREAFFGVSCTRMSPFPLLQVLLFNDEVISESPRLLKLRYSLEGSTLQSDGLQGVLKATDSVEEHSNKIRIEFGSVGLGSMQAMQEAYDELLDKLAASKTLKLELSHRTLGNFEYGFSLKGLGSLLTPYRDICR